LGGTRALTRHLYPLLSETDGPLRIVDAGTGGAGLAAGIARWASRHGRKIDVLGLDWAGRNLRVAANAVRRTNAARLVQADARCMPLAASAVDFVVSVLLMHHFPPQQLAEMLREAFTRARRGIVMSDLVRGRLPYLAYQLIQPVFARNRLTREDGLLSIRRAYTPSELEAIARSAGLPDPHVYTHWPWRMTLVVLK
jgi:SAM-dependent methyltransferase